MRDTNADAAAAVVERIRYAVESASWRSRHQAISVTISSGLTIFGPGVSKSPEQMLVAADEALYRAKRGGRNRTESAA